MSSKHYSKSLIIAVTLAAATLSGCSTTDTNNSQTQSTLRSTQTQTNDSRIATDVYNNFMKLPIASESHVNVSVWNGYILLTGEVPSQELKTKFQQIAEKTNGESHVYNAVKVSVNTSSWRRMQDTWITGRVKSALDIDSDRVFVLTENATVYLMGIVHSYEASSLVKQAANVSGVNGVVNAFQIVN